MKIFQATHATFRVSVFYFSAAILLSLLLAQSIADEDFDDEIMRQKIAESMDEHNMDPQSSYVMMPPKVSDEERGSHHLPIYLRCAGCLAVSHQFELAYKKAMRFVKPNGRLPLADQIDVAETVCNKNLHGYGLKEDKGKKMLSGPGLAADRVPGMMEAGGKWEARLKVLCLELTEEFEEEGIYDAYAESEEGGLAEEICGSYCKGKSEIESLKAAESSVKEEL